MSMTFLTGQRGNPCFEQLPITDGIVAIHACCVFINIFFRVLWIPKNSEKQIKPQSRNKSNCSHVKMVPKHKQKKYRMTVGQSKNRSNLYEWQVTTNIICQRCVFLQEVQGHAPPSPSPLWTYWKIWFKFVQSSAFISQTSVQSSRLLYLLTIISCWHRN